jgi:hypothetical protein
MLTKAEVIAPMGRFKRSESAAARGRKIYCYRLASERRARTFLERNGYTAEQVRLLVQGQPELPL